MTKAGWLGLAALMTATGASATTVNDASGDFLASFTGTQSGDLDILSVTATFDGANFLLKSVQNGVIGTAPTSLFVWGIDRGAGTERLLAGSPPVGQGVLFDAVAVFFPDGTGRVATFPAMGGPTITPLANAVTISGNSISGLVPLSLLPSRGLAPADYSFNLWSRQRVTAGVDGTNAEIADFAPNASSIVTSVPGPASWAMMILGFGAIGSAVRRRRSPIASHADPQGETP